MRYTSKVLFPKMQVKIAKLFLYRYHLICSPSAKALQGLQKLQLGSL